MIYEKDRRIIEMIEKMLSKVIEQLEPSATEEVDNAVKRMKQSGVDVIVPLGVGEPCFDTPAKAGIQKNREKRLFTNTSTIISKHRDLFQFEEIDIC